jgi:uncharacterized protein
VDATLNIRMRSMVLGLLVLVALLAGYVVGTAGGGAPVAAAPTSQPEPAEDVRSISMTGAGEAVGVPDQLSFRLSVNKQAADVSTALDQANATMRRVQKALQDEGVRRRDVQTSGLNIHPVYDYPENGPAVIVGYAVSERVGVLVRDLGRSGAAIAAAVEAGGNAVRVSGIELQIGRLEALMREARDSAVEEATAKAEQYAAATGQQLDAVVSIAEVSARRPRPVPVYEADLDRQASFSKVPVRAGSSELEVKVRVVWSFA